MLKVAGYTVSMTLNLTSKQIAALMSQDPAKSKRGGFQGFLVKLQKKYNPVARSLTLSAADLEKIPRYAFDYGSGGWETLLKEIFRDHLGENLGRPSSGG